MAEKSFCFNSINGDRKYKAEDFRDYFASFISNGVFPNPSNNLQVMGENSDMTITIKAGKGWINGAFYVNDADLILPIDVADGVLNRIDRIVLRMDTEGRAINAKVKKGTFASSPVAPDLQRDADAYELGIADILVSAGATSITQANITDQRLDNDLCGVVHGVVEQVDTTTLFNQYLSWYAQTTGQAITDINNIKAQFQDDFNTWFATIKDILDENAAGNLQNEIDTLKTDYVAHPANAGTTGGTSTAYTITTTPEATALIDKIGAVFTVHTNSGDNPTLQWGNLEAKPILKPNGSPAILKQNGLYTVRYNTVNDSFILQGEGGEYGTATQADVLNTVTFGTEQGPKQGTMDLSNLTPENIKKYVNINNVVGSYTFSYWTITQSLEGRRTDLAGCGAQSSALAFGGRYNEYLNTTEKFNGISWASTAVLNRIRYSLAGCGAQSSALAFGGDSGSGIVETTEKFNGSTWATTGSSNVKRFSLAGCGSQDAGLSFGGYNGTNQVATTEKFNGNTWSTTGNMSSARYNLAGCGTQSAGLSFGGTTGGTLLATTEKFNGTTWSTTGNLGIYRQQLAGFGDQISAVSCGGQISYPHVVSTAEKFNGVGWWCTGFLNLARYGLAGCGTQSAGLSFGGADGKDTVGFTEWFSEN